jgi:drug/metabolite transporter (DMT)-like permease
MNAGMARTSPQATAMISTISPLVTIALAVWILGEPFTAADALGSTMVLAGVGLYTWSDMARKKNPLPQEDV